MHRFSEEIPVRQVTILSEPSAHGRIVPRLYLFTGLESGLPEDMMEEVITSESYIEDDYEDDLSVPVYVIRDIIPLEDDEDHVRLIISLDHEKFDDDEQPEVLLDGQYVNYALSLVIPSAMLVTLRALVRGDYDAGIRVCAGTWDGSLRADWDGGMFPLISISFPPEGYSRTWKRLTEELMNISEGFYADSDESQASGTPDIFRKAQRDLFRIISALMDGSVEDGWEPLVGMKKYLEGRHHAGDGSPSDEDGETASDKPLLRGIEADYSDFLVDRILKTYSAFIPMEMFTGLTDSAHQGMELSGDEESEVHYASEFAQILAFNEIEEGLESVDANHPHFSLPLTSEDQYKYANPLSRYDELPDPVKKMLAHIESIFPEVLELTRWDFSREPVLRRASLEYGIFATRVSMVLSAALSIALLKANKPKSQPLLALITLLSNPEDAYPWELTAFDSQLVEYDTEGFTQLLCSVSSVPNDADSIAEEEPHNAFYIIPALIQLFYQTQQENWSITNVDERLSHVVATPEMGKVRSLLVCMADSNESGVDIEEAINTVIQGYDLKFLSTAIPYVVTSLSEYAARERRLPLGSPEWKGARQEYIKELTTAMSFRLRRIHR